MSDIEDFRAINAAYKMIEAKGLIFESASIARNQPLMESTRADAHAALDAWLDAIDASRKRGDDRLRRMIGG